MKINKSNLSETVEQVEESKETQLSEDLLA